MITQQTLFTPAKPKDEIAIMRLKEFEPPEGYYVAFSGGKDSVTVLDLVRRSGVKYDAHYSLTTVDPPELVRFIKTFPDVETHRPKQTMWQLIQKKTMPPTRMVRYCCQVLKEGGGAGRQVVVTGVRWAESAKRAKRRMLESCQKKGENKMILNPIVDWTNAEVWEYIKINKVPYSELYDEGFKRLGCIMCPMQGRKGMLRDAQRWPKYYNAYLHTFGKMLIEKRKKHDMTITKWNTAQDVMDWWMSDASKGDPDQTVMFE